MSKPITYTDAQMQVFDSLERIASALDREHIHRPVMQRSLWTPNALENGEVEFTLHFINDQDALACFSAFKRASAWPRLAQSNVQILTSEISEISPEQEGQIAESLETYRANKFTVARLNQFLDSFMPLPGMFHLVWQHEENNFAAVLTLGPSAPFKARAIAETLTKSKIPRDFTSSF